MPHAIVFDKSATLYQARYKAQPPSNPDPLCLVNAGKRRLNEMTTSQPFQTPQINCKSSSRRFSVGHLNVRNQRSGARWSEKREWKKQRWLLANKIILVGQAVSPSIEEIHERQESERRHFKLLSTLYRPSYPQFLRHSAALCHNGGRQRCSKLLDLILFIFPLSSFLWTMLKKRSLSQQEGEIQTDSEIDNSKRIRSNF